MYEEQERTVQVGYTKRLMELHESQQVEAAAIAVEAGVLRRCELHPEITINQFADPSPAYKIANARFTANKLENNYASRRELTDAIQTAIEDALIDGLPPV